GLQLGLSGFGLLAQAAPDINFKAQKIKQDAADGKGAPAISRNRGRTVGGDPRGCAVYAAGNLRKLIGAGQAEIGPFKIDARARLPQIVISGDGGANQPLKLFVAETLKPFEI